MPSNYESVLHEVRRAFPSPFADTDSDNLFATQMARALSGIGAYKKNGQPVIGERVSLDYSAARQKTLAEAGLSVEEATADLVSRCEGLINPAHPHTQRQVVPPTTMSSLLAVVLSSVHNANIGWDEYSQRIALAEVEVTAMLSHLIGYDPESSGGLSTFGGTGANLYGVKVGLEKAVPEAMRHGVEEKTVVVTSDASHYGRANITGWLGIGSDNLVIIPTTTCSAVRTDILRERLRELLQDGVRVATILATLGTTDAFGMDNLAEIAEIRDEMVAEFDLPYRIHIHADAVAGWVWAVFNDYDFTANPLGLRPQTAQVLQRVRDDVCHLHLADSIAIDFHKSGFAPYISSMILFKNRNDLQLLSRPQEQAPCLYQFGDYRPGMYTLEGSRAGSGVLAGLINLRLFGKEGLKVIIAHLTEMSLLLRQKLGELGYVTILNADNFGSVTLFRVYPESAESTYKTEIKDPSQRDKLLFHNDYNRRVFNYLHQVGQGAMFSPVDPYCLTDYGEPMLALKSYIMSPFTTADTIATTVERIVSARKNVDASGPAQSSSCNIST